MAEPPAAPTIDVPPAASLDAAPVLCVRRATRGDHPAVVALLCDLELDYPGRDLGSFFVGDLPGGVTGEVVAVAELRAIGSGHLLSCVGVREDLQGRGFGRALVEGVLAGVTGDVWLYTLVPGFFARVGFEVVAAPCAGVPPRLIYGCQNCDPSRCRCMVRRAAREALPDDGPIRAEHLDALAAALPRSADATCDLSAASLWIWRDCEAPSVARIHGNLCIRLDPHHELPYFLEPLGEGDPAASVEGCLGRTGRLSRVRAGLLERLPAGRYETVPLREHFDYLYEVRDIAELRGAPHEGHRNRVRKFAREHPRHEVRALAARDRDAALALFDRWALGVAERDGPAGGAPVPALGCQRRAIERAFEDFDRLGLGGCALVEDGALLGFLAGSRSGDAVIAHFKYADASLPGAAQTLLVEGCRGVFAGATWIDLEEDLGLPGLRRTKLAWQPARLVEKFLVTPRARPCA